MRYGSGTLSGRNTSTTVLLCLSPRIFSGRLAQFLDICVALVGASSKALEPVTTEPIHIVRVTLFAALARAPAVVLCCRQGAPLDAS